MAKRRPISHATFARRRFVGWGSLLIACLVLFLFVGLLRQSLWQSSFVTGYIFLGCLLFLAAFNLRKKIPVLPILGSSRLWMQAHVYIGFFTIALFLVHVGWRIPTGTFEQFLAALYTIVATSGIYGLYVTRTVPQKLTAVKNEVIFEEIPFLRGRIAQQARGLLSDPTTGSDVLVKFYVNHLARFLERPRSFGYLLVPSSRQSKQLIADIRNMDRYLSIAQRRASRKLTELVQHKEDLDYHFAMQGRLKVWLFVHVGLTYGLLITAILHAVVAHAFAGGLR